MKKSRITVLHITGPRSDRLAFQQRTDIEPAIYRGDWNLFMTSPLVPVVSVGAPKPPPTKGVSLRLAFNGILPVPSGLLLNPYVCRNVTTDGERWERDHWSCPRYDLIAVGWQVRGGLHYQISARGRPIRFIHAASVAFPSLTFTFADFGHPTRIRRFRGGASNLTS